MAKRLPPRSSQKRPTDELPLAPLKALKASPGSSAYWVAEAQAAMQRGAASARADPKEPATQGGAVEATPTQMGEGVLLPHEGEAHESDRAGVPLVAKAPGVFEAKAMEAGAPKTAETAEAAVGVSATTEATMAEAGAPETIKAIIAEAGAPEIAKADVMAVRPSIQEVEMKAAEALVAPLVQGQPLLRESAREAEVYPISSDNTSRVREVVDAKETGAMEQPAPILGEGSLALVRARPEPRGWDHPRVLWWSRDNPKGESLFALEDAAEESEAEVTRAAEASSVVQMVLDTEIGEHEVLKRAALFACEALEVEGVQSGSFLGSRLIMLSS
ncbi:uncharacterized protein [Miscanthus floridulus]|uniref:uncharacterized protein n=1 Tax=Miscanthus floridulus TaxID=154761 RepID=UPI003458983A